MNKKDMIISIYFVFGVWVEIAGYFDGDGGTAGVIVKVGEISKDAVFITVSGGKSGLCKEEKRGKKCGQNSKKAKARHTESNFNMEGD